MKDETCGVDIKGFVGSKSKMHTFTTKENHESKRAKSINKNVFDFELNCEAYKFFLFNRSYKRHWMNRIQRKYHNIGSYTINNFF